ncbi:MAG: BrnA antitoxin family protein [Candidatus Shapirobacteria bacterium]|nr:BrnA antitoxin family protein [Candidatus Shapirobacteria bacterium]
MNKLKKIPTFKNEDDEFEFWEHASFSDYFDLSKAKRGIMFPNLKLTTRLVTIRLPIGLIERLKNKANKMDVPYQALIKQELFKSLQIK